MLSLFEAFAINCDGTPAGKENQASSGISMLLLLAEDAGDDDLVVLISIFAHAKGVSPTKLIPGEVLEENARLVHARRKLF